MANEKVTQLPTVVNSTLSDIIYAVQGGVSVQETLQQVYTLFTNTDAIANFSAYTNVTPTVTGDGTDYTILATNIMVNVGAQYNPTTGVFTAPSPGAYFFGMTVQMDGFLVANTGAQITVTQAGSFSKVFTLFDIGSIGTIYDGSTTTLSGSIILNMSTNDTATFKVKVSGNGAPNVNILDSTCVFGNFIS